MKNPTKTLFGLTWVGWLNFILLQWLFVRLAYGDGWHLLLWPLPLRGWWNDYRLTRTLRLGKGGNP